MIWQPSNVYKTAKLGFGVNVGAFTEIGNNVVIGDRTRIGAFCFIPEGVTIEEDVFIGPHVCFTNDRYPPSPSKKMWQKTVVKRGAAIGAACVVLPGITIGENATIGAGSVVTHDVPPNEIWAGNPARPVRFNRDARYAMARVAEAMRDTHEPE